MKRVIATISQWMAGRLAKLVTVLDNVGRANAQSKFVHLAPTDEADKAGVYARALLYATNEAKVRNIALTGPYGSGKSSIIQSFLKRYPGSPLHISLAAFVPEADARGSKVTRQEIERSILQQMLYGPDANSLPLSRFKRIQSPGVLAILKSLCIMVGIIALWYIFSRRDELIGGSFLTPLTFGNWLNLGSFTFAAVFLWVVLHHFYVASFGLSLKGISLKDIEIRPASDNQDSILNRHLDEIIYFFQSTNYDLVVIEDLDRFEEAEIFVNLREINSLVNDNAGIKRIVRFLYALRDDVFVNTDRTKFFEFIVPVIPIINASNSIDMVLEQGKRLEIDNRLDRQFLREVSRYLNDLRLIQNIFNEYAIYVDNLETDDENVLNANKLLAVLIYKNVYPRDFERLHRGEGNFAGILSRREELIAQAEAAARSEIAEIEQRVEAAEQQTPSDLKELRQIYALAFLETLPPYVFSIGLGSTWITIPELAGHDAFEQLIETQQLSYRTTNGSFSHRHNVAKFQTDVDSQQSYKQRKTAIEDKASANKLESMRRVRELRSKIATLRTIKLHELMRINTDRVSDLFDGFGERGELARFLILEGYLDDTYYQYTSLFHSGRLSPNDNKFLIQIRAFVTPEPRFPIDNPKEVIAAMRDEDFRQSYVLNVKLVDCLLNDQAGYADQISKFFWYLSSEFQTSEGFFDAYYASGRNVSDLLSGLIRAWEQFVQTAILSPRKIIHITQLLLNIPDTSLKSLASDVGELSEFVSAHLPEVLAQAPDLPPERLEVLDFEVKDLNEIKEHPAFARFMFEKGRFGLTKANVEYIYKEILGESNLNALRTRNYTTLRASGNSILIERIERDFNLYLDEVLLKLPNNASEDASAMLAVVQRENLDKDSILEFLARQTTMLPTLEGVPEKLFGSLFRLHRIEPTWTNCLTFLQSEGFEPEPLVGYLNNDDVRATILREAIPNGTDTLSLRKFLIEAASLEDSAYKEYVHCLPKPFTKIPNGLGPAKIQILIEEEKITFNKENVDALADNADLQVLFVAANIDAYVAQPDLIVLDDDFRERLLHEDIGVEKKRALINLMDIAALAAHPQRAATIGPILDRTDINISGLDATIAEALIVHSTPIATQISLFNKCHSVLTDDDVRKIIDGLPKPFSDIKTGNYSARLPNSAENLALVKWLDSRNIVSSWSEGGWLSDVIRVNPYRR